MVGICFKFNDGYSELLRDQFYLLHKAFPGLLMYERNVPEEEKPTYDRIPFVRVNSGNDLPKSATLVVLSNVNSEYIPGQITLEDYVHPEDAIYFFGGDDWHLLESDVLGGNDELEYDKVYIPIDISLWSPQAAAIVLYDRQVKNGRSDNRQ